MNDDTPTEPPPAPPEHRSLTCEHGVIKATSYGVRKCSECGSIEGVDKVWRHPDVMWPA